MCIQKVVVNLGQRLGLLPADVERFYEKDYLLDIGNRSSNSNQAPAEFFDSDASLLNNGFFLGGLGGEIVETAINGPRLLTSTEHYISSLKQASKLLQSNFANCPQLVFSDMACGVGASTVSLAAVMHKLMTSQVDDSCLQSPELHVTGYDINPLALDLARQKEYYIWDLYKGYFEEPERQISYSANLENILEEKAFLLTKRQAAELNSNQVTEHFIRFYQQGLTSVQERQSEAVNEYLFPKLQPLETNGRYKLKEPIASLVNYKQIKPFVSYN